MLQMIVKRTAVDIDYIVIDYPSFSDIDELVASKKVDNERIEEIKESIIKNGFDPLGLKDINGRPEVDHPYILRSLGNGKYGKISGRTGRTYALKILKNENILDRVEIFACDFVHYPENFSETIKPNTNYGGFQKITFSDKNHTVIAGRDDIEKKFWHNFGVTDYFWLDKKVIDVSCNIGAWSFMAKERGAAYVEGFDVNCNAINVANNIKNTLSLDNIVFRCSSFENYKFEKKFDVAFLNQCVYHFNLDEGETFQRIVPHADFLFIYTFMTHKPEGNPKLGTYIPTKEKLKNHLTEAGYQNIYIIDHLSEIKKIKEDKNYGGKKYIICCKPNITPLKLKYFVFDALLLEKKNLVVYVLSGDHPRFLQWWLPKSRLERLMIND